MKALRCKNCGHAKRMHRKNACVRQHQGMRRSWTGSGWDLVTKDCDCRGYVGRDDEH